MSDFYEIFDTALGQSAPPDAQRAAAVVDVVSHRVRSRRRARAATMSLGGVLGIGVLGLGIYLVDPRDADADAGPAASGSTSHSPHVSPSGDASPSASARADSWWASPQAGSFVVATPREADGGTRLGLTIILPDGTLVDAGAVEEPYTKVSAWTPAGLLLTQGSKPRQTALWSGDTGTLSDVTPLGESSSVIAVVGGHVVLSTLPDQGEGAQTRRQLSVAMSDGEVDLCDTGDASDSSLTLSPDGKTLVCLEPVDAHQSNVIVATVNPQIAVNQVATFTHPASDYTRIGWVSDTELLFARALAQGYRYFTLDTSTGTWSDTFLPGDLDGTLPVLDQSTGSYVVSSWGNAVAYDAAGTVLGEVPCADNKPVVVMAQARALIACQTSEGTHLAQINLQDGTVHGANGEAPLLTLTVGFPQVMSYLAPFDPR